MGEIKDLKITALQTQLDWEDIAANLERFDKLLSKLDKGRDVVVLPEMFNSGFTMNVKENSEPPDGKTTSWLSEKARMLDTDITGSLIIEENDKFYNRMMWMRPSGICSIYDKRHLFRMAGEQNYFTAGKKRVIVKKDGWRICPLICYDLRFPGWSRNTFIGNSDELIFRDTENAYDVLVYVANWPERRKMAWNALLASRAIENQCYVVGLNRVGMDGNDVTYSGDSVIINPSGEVISKLKAGEEGFLEADLSWNELQRFREEFPVGLDKDDVKIG